MSAIKQSSDVSMPWRLVIRTACCPRIAVSSLRIALVVGLVLNAINHGGALWNGRPVSLAHVLMNFLVPFCVSGYSAAKNELTRLHGERAEDTDCIPADE